ncbi:MAG: flagellar hook assembly protein FlgD [Burkholderiales bacterium]|nr:flagellar hook assembly protein FlgD [Burkholderiales bacterium]
MTTTAVTAERGQAAGAATTKRGTDSAAGATEDRFLALLVAQMKNQDPLNPLDNAQVTSQLAQISTVNGIEKLNETLGRLMASNDSMRSLQAAAVVGREVLVDGNTIALAGGKAGTGGFELAEAADEVVIKVTSAAGLEVNRVTVRDVQAGIHGFLWDGKTDAGVAAADGRYTFSVQAKRGTAEVSATPLVGRRVDGVSNTADGLSLATEGGAIDWAKVKQVM